MALNLIFHDPSKFLELGKVFEMQITASVFIPRNYISTHHPLHLLPLVQEIL